MALNTFKPSENKYLKGLIYGPPGHGKTHLLGTSLEDPRTNPMLVISFEGGYSTLSGLDIDVVKIESWKDYNEVYAELENGSKYKSVGIDSISETQTFGLLDLLEKEAPNRKDPNLLQQQDYGKVLIQMRKFLRAFRDLPYHVVFIAGAKEDQDSREGLVKKPAMTGQLADEVTGMMDLVGYLALKDDDEGQVMRSLLLQNWPRIRCKVRTPWGAIAPNEIEHPDMNKVMNVLGFPMPREAPKKTDK